MASCFSFHLSLRHNNSELLSAEPVGTLRERVFQVFGSTILDDLTDLGDQERELKMPLDETDMIERHFRLINIPKKGERSAECHALAGAGSEQAIELARPGGICNPRHR